MIALSNELLSLQRSKNISQTILMPYSSKLKELTAWFVQLWAESLGKKLDKNGKTVNAGLTPICAVGAIDQHAQVQLFMEGPKDKFILFIEVLNSTANLKLTNSIQSDKCSLLNNFSLHQLMKAELVGTQQAADDHGVPHGTLLIDKVDETSVGALIFYFETLTMITGQLLNIDPFDQPGVEAGKIYAFKWLKENL
jgi:glucose-6-phosphate isomerase